jgi:hypothetical protein
MRTLFTHRSIDTASPLVTRAFQRHVTRTISSHSHGLARVALHRHHVRRRSGRRKIGPSQSMRSCTPSCMGAGQPHRWPANTNQHSLLRLDLPTATVKRHQGAQGGSWPVGFTRAHRPNRRGCRFLATATVGRSLTASHQPPTTPGGFTHLLPLLPCMLRMVLSFTLHAAEGSLIHSAGCGWFTHSSPYMPRAAAIVIVHSSRVCAPTRALCGRSWLRRMDTLHV